MSEVSFRIEGDLAELGRLLAYGPLWRRLSRRVAGIRLGHGTSIAALDAMVGGSLSLSELSDAGVRLGPDLALRLIAQMIKPSWTKGERFTIRHESDLDSAGATYLTVSDGSRPTVSAKPPAEPVATTIRCPDEQLLALLEAGSAPDATILGATAPVARLREWIVRAERD